jgi:hypothetical protein
MGVGIGLSGRGGGRGSGWMSRIAGNLSIIVFTLCLGGCYCELNEFFSAED